MPVVGAIGKPIAGPATRESWSCSGSSHRQKLLGVRLPFFIASRRLGKSDCFGIGLAPCGAAKIWQIKPNFAGL
jgi:hypothetical protein